MGKEQAYMPVYVQLVRFTDQGIKTVKEAAPRWERVRAAVENAGGRVIGNWWTHGPYDAVGVIEWPDDESASVAALAAAMGGNVRAETMRAYTDEEMQRLLQRLP